MAPVSPILMVKVWLLLCRMIRLTLRLLPWACRRLICVLVVRVGIWIYSAISDLNRRLSMSFVRGFIVALVLLSSVLWSRLRSWVVRVGLVRRRPGARFSWASKSFEGV